MLNKLKELFFPKLEDKKQIKDIFFVEDLKSYLKIDFSEVIFVDKEILEKMELANNDELESLKIEIFEEVEKVLKRFHPDLALQKEIDGIIIDYNAGMSYSKLYAKYHRGQSFIDAVVKGDLSKLKNKRYPIKRKRRANKPRLAKFKKDI